MANKFTMEDVDKRIDEIRERHRRPKRIEGRGLFGRLLTEARRRRMTKPPEVKT